MRIKKKNTRGSAKNYITRTQAIKKLQISLADFRRLCIFKGIYPREPRNKRKANKGSTAPTTFYYAKDIQYLLHEPVLEKFREHKTFAKKLTRALGRGDISSAKKLEENRTTYKLDHIIKERYPSFADALRDIDDALNMLFLFANLPATNKISAKVTSEAQTICNEWMAYIARERLVRKVFVSIKGVYYQAIVRGEEVRWIVPYKFPENIPSSIDLRIMLTFLEFYSTLMHFVLYKLYTDSGLVYPPKLDVGKDKIVSGLSSYILDSREQTKLLSTPKVTSSESSNEVRQLDSKALESAINADIADESLSKGGEEAVEQEKDQIEEEEREAELDTFEDLNKHKGDILAQPSKYESPVATLFSNFVFYISREVPLDILEFLILSAGGSVVSEIALEHLGPDQSIDLSKVTHQIVDRPVLKNKVPGRTYVQPQWVFDSINKGELVPTSQYLPGETLPPHLSPWGDAVGYDPNAEDEDEEEEEGEGEEQEEVKSDADKMLEGENGTAGEEVEREPNQKEEEEEESEEDEELVAQRELEMEAKGISYSGAKTEQKTTTGKTKKRSAETEEEEEKKLKMIMMTNKQRKLYKKMEYSNKQKNERIETLKKKKRQIAKLKNKMKDKTK